MNVSKTLASAVAAMAVAGSIGFAYAQTTTDSTTGGSPSQSMNSNNTMGSPTNRDLSTMPNSDTRTDGSTMSTDLAPQTDRG